jgi:hypothetical protein
MAVDLGPNAAFTLNSTGGVAILRPVPGPEFGEEKAKISEFFGRKKRNLRQN